MIVRRTHSRSHKYRRFNDQALAVFQLNGSSSARRLMGLEAVPGQIETVKTAPGQKQRFHVSWILPVSHSKTKIVTRHQVPSILGLDIK